MTPILQVLTQYCSVYVDDMRLEELAEADQPLWARKMWGYLLPAISLFTVPTEIQDFLVGDTTKPKLVYPQYADTLYTVTDGEKTVDFTVELGEEYAGYEVCACRVMGKKNGTTFYSPLTVVSYDSTTGNVMIAASKTNPVAEGSVIDFDFYTDGYFVNDLSTDVQNILGMCFQVVWQDRFNTDWLSNVSKVEDKSFFEQNRANKERADTERLEMLRRKLAGEMRLFEQNAYYRKVVPVSNRLSL